jgi:HK97 family phage portal protein
MWPFRRKEERATTLEEILLKSGVLTSTVSKKQALNVPALSACIELISMTVASLPVKLYSETGETTKSEDDPRTALLNDDTKDTLDGFQFKKALVEDYLLLGGGYAFINRKLNEVASLHYVENPMVAINKNVDPIFKKAEIHVNGESFRDFQFVKLLRKTKDGVTGQGILAENNTMLSVAYNQMVYEEVLVKTGGNKKGFLKSQGRLSKEAMDELKKGWKELYANNDENVLVLNNGLEFQEASQTSVEMQLNEHKRSNSDEICKLFLVPPNILTGEANEEEYNNWIKICILPILAAFESALNKDLLLPSEKENRFFAFDTTDLTKGDIEKRFKAYELGIKNGVLQIDEARYKENLPPLGLKFLKLGLQDVLYFADSEEIYTPNTNKLAKMGENPTVEANGGTNNVQPNQGLSNNSGLGTTEQGQSDNTGQGN